MHDQVPFAVVNTQVFPGPTAICALAGTGIECIADSEAAGSYIPVSSSTEHFPDTWTPSGSMQRSTTNANAHAW